MDCHSLVACVYSKFVLICFDSCHFHLLAPGFWWMCELQSQFYWNSNQPTGHKEYSLRSTVAAVLTFQSISSSRKGHNTNGFTRNPTLQAYACNTKKCGSCVAQNQRTATWRCQRCDRRWREPMRRVEQIVLGNTKYLQVSWITNSWERTRLCKIGKWQCINMYLIIVREIPGHWYTHQITGDWWFKSTNNPWGCNHRMSWPNDRLNELWAVLAEGSGNWWCGTNQ